MDDHVATETGPVPQFFKATRNEPHALEKRWKLLRYYLLIARTNLVASFEQLLPLLSYLSSDECKKILRFCAKRQKQSGEGIQYSALLISFLKHLPTDAMFTLLTANDIESDHRRFVLKYLSHQPYNVEMIKLVPIHELPVYFAILEQTVASAKFILGLSAAQISGIFYQMHPCNQNEDICLEDWKPIYIALCKHITQHTWWSGVTPLHLQSPHFPCVDGIERIPDFETFDLYDYSAKFWFIKKMLETGNQTQVMVRLLQDLSVFEDFLQFSIFQDAREYDLIELVLLLELQVQDTRCVISHILDWEKRVTVDCGPAQALRIGCFVASLLSAISTQSHFPSGGIHVHSQDVQEPVSMLGKREYPELEGDSDLAFVCGVARTRLASGPLESFLNSLSIVFSHDPMVTSATGAQVFEVIVFLIDIVEDAATSLLRNPVGPNVHQIAKSVYPLLTRSLHAATRNTELRTYYHARATGSVHTSIPRILLTAIELLSALLGNDPPQTCDVIAHFVQRFLEVSSQDPKRTEDAARFEQFTNCLIWVWDRYYELLFKFDGLRKAARAAGSQNPPKFIDIVNIFLLQMVSKLPADQAFVPGITVLSAPSAAPLRTSGTHASPSTQHEPAFAAHHAPYVLAALLKRIASNLQDRVAVQLDATVIVTIVSACRQDSTKWKCFKVLLFWLEEVPVIAKEILLANAEHTEQQHFKMKALMGCVAAHLKLENQYRQLSGAAYGVLGALMYDRPSLFLLLSFGALGTTLVSMLSSNNANGKINATMAIQMLISHAIDKSQDITPKLVSFCDRNSLATTLVDHIIANKDEVTKDRNAEACANLLDALHKMVSKVQGQLQKLMPRAAELLSFLGHKNIFDVLQNQEPEVLKYVNGIAGAIVRENREHSHFAASIVALELEFLAKSPYSEANIICVLELLEEIVAGATAMLHNFEMHVKIKAFMNVYSKRMTKQLGQRILDTGRRIASAGNV